MRNEIRVAGDDCEDLVKRSTHKAFAATLVLVVSLGASALAVFYNLPSEVWIDLPGDKGVSVDEPVPFCVGDSIQYAAGNSTITLDRVEVLFSPPVNVLDPDFERSAVRILAAEQTRCDAAILPVSTLSRVSTPAPPNTVIVVRAVFIVEWSDGSTCEAVGLVYRDEPDGKLGEATARGLANYYDIRSMSVNATAAQSIASFLLGESGGVRSPAIRVNSLFGYRAHM